MKGYFFPNSMNDNPNWIGYCGWDVVYLFIQKFFSLPSLFTLIIIIGTFRIPKEEVGIFIKDSVGLLANNNILVIILILLIFIVALWKIKNAEINRVASERNFYQEKSGIDTQSSEV